MRNVSKSYGEIHAVDDATLTLELGRMHAIVGENGAGKTTLLKIAAGLTAPDRGHVEIEGTRVHDARTAIRAGVGMVTQHFSLVPTLTALENIVLGFEPTRSVVLDMRSARANVTRVLRELGVELDLDAITSTLGVGERQRLEIARVLFREAKIVILDEPTALLAPQEADALYAMLTRMASAGRAVAVVTHKLDEVYAHADAVTVMRRGKIVGTREAFRTRVKEEVIGELTREIMGGEPPHAVSPPARTPAADALVIDALVVPPRLRGATLRVRTGEIVGVCGIEGSGQEELVHALAGLVRPASGHVRMPGSDRCAVVFADRHREGLVLDASVEDNAILGEHAGFFLDRAGLRKEARSRIERAHVVPPDLDALAGSLSGGNQQKIVVERACARADGKKIRALVLAHPTRGVDVGAARQIHERIADVASRGVGVLVLGSDIEELRALCDRMLVMARGRIAGEVQKDAPLARIGELMLGAVA